MTVLVTGAGGFIGSWAMEGLRKSGLPVVGVGRGQLELGDAAAVGALFRELKPSRVLHLAGSLQRGEDAAARERQWADTFSAGRVVVEEAAAAGVEQLIIAGSVDELGDAAGVLPTDVPAMPRSSYGLCKSLLREVAGFAARRSGMRVDWFRPFTVYGPGQRGEMLIPYAFGAAREGRPADFTDGLQERDFLYVGDLVDWLLLALQANVDSGRGALQVHHLGTGSGTVVRDVLAEIASAFPGSQFRLGARSRRAGEPLTQVAPQQRPAESPLDGWLPKVSWPDGIARTAAWWRGRR